PLTSLFALSCTGFVPSDHGALTSSPTTSSGSSGRQAGACVTARLGRSCLTSPQRAQRDLRKSRGGSPLVVSGQKYQKQYTRWPGAAAWRATVASPCTAYSPCVHAAAAADSAPVSASASAPVSVSVTVSRPASTTPASSLKISVTWAPCLGSAAISWL